MRPILLLAAIPLALACAAPIAVQTAAAPADTPSDAPLTVKLHEPANGVFQYSLSEPAYVAIFAVTRGYGSRLVYPYFEKPSTWPHTHHVHLCKVGSEQERRHLAFRDYLRAHSDVADRYVELKRKEWDEYRVQLTPWEHEKYLAAL